MGCLTESVATMSDIMYNPTATTPTIEESGENGYAHYQFKSRSSDSDVGRMAKRERKYDIGGNKRERETKPRESKRERKARNGRTGTG